MVVYAQKFGALLVALEHRFYGESKPTDDLSTDNLRFLSSQQAYLIISVLSKSDSNNPCIDWLMLRSS